MGWGLIVFRPSGCHILSRSAYRRDYILSWSRKVMEYEDNCNCCGTELRITGAYIGNYEDCYCEDCGWDGEHCGLDCRRPMTNEERVDFDIQNKQDSTL